MAFGLPGQEIDQQSNYQTSDGRQDNDIIRAHKGERGLSFDKEEVLDLHYHPPEEDCSESSTQSYKNRKYQEVACIRCPEIVEEPLVIEPEFITL